MPNKGIHLPAGRSLFLVSYRVPTPLPPSYAFPRQVMPGVRRHDAALFRWSRISSMKIAHRATLEGVRRVTLSRIRYYLYYRGAKCPPLGIGVHWRTL